MALLQLTQSGLPFGNLQSKRAAMTLPLFKFDNLLRGHRQNAQSGGVRSKPATRPSSCGSIIQANAEHG